MELLRDPIWQSIGVVVALFLPIVLFQIQRHRKRIVYEIISSTLLLSVNGEVKGKVQILFGGKPVGDVSMCVLRICNSGNVPIMPAEYDRPIKFSFGKRAEVLDVEILDTTPDNIKVSVRNDSKNVVVEPLLLNSKDSFVLKVLLNNFTNEINADARIVGVKQILSYRSPLASIVNIL